MILELTGTRVLAPYVGTSIFVWTSLIGIILASLSLGYYLGGILADKKQDAMLLAYLLLSAGLWIGLSAFYKDKLLYGLSEIHANICLKSFLETVILFAFPNILLGITVPYIVKLRLGDYTSCGKTVGNLYALSTLGSILGTFLGGYVLIPFLGSAKILIIIAFTLIVFSLLVFIFSRRRRLTTFFKIAILLIFLLMLAGLAFTLKNEHKFKRHKISLIDVETLYNRVWIYDSINGKGDLIKIMRINNEGNSAEYLFKEGLVADYLKFFRLAEHFNPSFQKTLMLGGAAYSYPKNYLKRFKHATMDVVEIDPELTLLAKKHFALKEDPRLKIIHQDARLYLNHATQRYDVILVDAFNSLSTLPYQITTTEAVEHIYSLLNEKGIVMVNLISSIDGIKGEFTRAEYATYESVFPQVYLFQIDKEKKREEVQNILLVAFKTDQMPLFRSVNEEYNEYLSHLVLGKIQKDMPVLTDEYAPVEYYIGKAMIEKEALSH